MSTPLDITGYTWVGNESIDVTSKINLFIDFKDNLDTIYNRITTLYNINLVYSYSTDYSSVAYSNGWNEEFYKTITFTSGTATDYSTGVDKTADLVAWLESNGTLTPPSPTGKKVLKINSKLVSKVNDSLVASWNGEEIYPTPMGEQPQPTGYDVNFSYSNSTPSYCEFYYSLDNASTWSPILDTLSLQNVTQIKFKIKQFNTGGQYYATAPAVYNSDYSTIVMGDFQPSTTKETVSDNITLNSNLTGDISCPDFD